jgi:hypothetical protein
MLYAILCYNSDEVIATWSQEEDAAVMARLAAVQEELARLGKLGPTARLQPTKTAKTIRKSENLMVVDGPFAETKEQLLGFYLVDCADENEAVEIARRLSAANRGVGGYEIRPVSVYFPSMLPA